jgi:hypothetical protein
VSRSLPVDERHPTLDAFLNGNDGNENVSLVTLNPPLSLLPEDGVVSQLVVMIRVENMRLCPLVLLRSPLGPQPGRFPVERLPLGNSDYLLPGIPRPGLYRGFKAGHPPLQIG